MLQKSKCFLFVWLIISCCFADASTDCNPYYRAVLKTTTVITVNSQEKTVSSLSTIAVKGNKYRLQIVKPAPMIYICDGAKSVSVNPVTQERTELPAGRENAAGFSDLFGSFSDKPAGQDIAVEEAWGLPENIKKIRISRGNGWTVPEKVVMFDAAGEQQGEFTVKSVQTMCNKSIPEKTVYSSETVTVTVEYEDVRTDPHMPDEIFSTEEP